MTSLWTWLRSKFGRPSTKAPEGWIAIDRSTLEGLTMTLLLDARPGLAPNRYKSHRVEVVWAYESEDGMPDDHTFDAREDFDLGMEGHFEEELDMSILVRTRLGGGRMEWLYYSSTPDKLVRHAQNLFVGAAGSIPITFQVSEDPDWQEWRASLPTGAG